MHSHYTRLTRNLNNRCLCLLWCLDSKVSTLPITFISTCSGDMVLRINTLSHEVNPSAGITTFFFLRISNLEFDIIQIEHIGVLIGTEVECNTLETSTFLISRNLEFRQLKSLPLSSILWITKSICINVSARKTMVLSLKRTISVSFNSQLQTDFLTCRNWLSSINKELAVPRTVSTIITRIVLSQITCGFTFCSRTDHHFDTVI